MIYILLYILAQPEPVTLNKAETLEVITASYAAGYADGYTERYDDIGLVRLTVEDIEEMI